MKKTLATIAAVGTLAGIAGCTADKTAKKAGNNAASEQRAVADSFGRVAGSQQVPTFDYSQHRQTLIDVESVQATGAVSTTQFFLEGIGLVAWCPSIGLPVPSTAQLSPSQSWVDLPGDRSKTWRQVDQGEPTGIYVGQSSGTYTMCLDDQGKKFAQYWEGYVYSTVGVVPNLAADKRVRIAQATFQFAETPKKR